MNAVKNPIGATMTTDTIVDTGKISRSPNVAALAVKPEIIAPNIMRIPPVAPTLP